MTLPIAARIADAVAAEINTAVAASAFETVGFTAYRRQFDWDNSFTKLKGLVVEVVYSTMQPEGSVKLVAHGRLGYEIKVDVVVLKRFAPEDKDQNIGRLNNDAPDALVRLVEQIHEYFIAKRDGTPLGDEPEAKWIAAQPHWCHQGLMREGIFHGAVRLTFSTKKAI